MKKIKLCLILWIMMIWAEVSCIPLIADVNVPVDLVPDVDTPASETDYDAEDQALHYRYRIVVPGEGYITVSAHDDEPTSPCVSVYRKLNSTVSLAEITQEDMLSGNNQFPVGKGEYYLTVDTDDILLRYSFTAGSFSSNYCRRKAVSLKKGDAVTICQTPGRNYNRWFKVSLSKKQRITVRVKPYRHIDQIRLYDRRCRGIDLQRRRETAGSCIFYSKKLPKGTYYVTAMRAGTQTYDRRSGFYVSTLYRK